MCVCEGGRSVVLIRLSEGDKNSSYVCTCSKIINIKKLYLQIFAVY